MPYKGNTANLNQSISRSIHLQGEIFVLRSNVFLRKAGRSDRDVFFGIYRNF